MAHDEKQYNSKFTAYMLQIIQHPNYQGLPIKKRQDGSYVWVAPKKSEIGIQRKNWCLQKARELHFTSGNQPYPGMYAQVMLAIHPTKRKVCQICGREMSLYYHYPNADFLKSLNERFHSDFTYCDSIFDIWDRLTGSGISEREIAAFFIKKGDLDSGLLEAGKQTVIDALERECRNGSKKCLGPGAMSNFPDRFDGFHSYNRCCRSSQDKGRSKENLKSYTKDRRAYEYWSDGNIHAANQFMGSPFFKGISADHIGPISLGFVHDSVYLQPMEGSDNSSKRDRLQAEDINAIIKIQKRTGIYPMSWQSRLIWEFIKDNYQTNPHKVSDCYQNALKQNMANYMFILYCILEKCPVNGENFLIKALLEPHYHCFHYSYQFNSRGEIIACYPRHDTEQNQNETDRYQRVAIQSVYHYIQKKNRNKKQDLSSVELQHLNDLCRQIEQNPFIPANKASMATLVEQIETRIIASL